MRKRSPTMHDPLPLGSVVRSDLFGQGEVQEVVAVWEAPDGSKKFEYRIKPLGTDDFFHVLESGLKLIKLGHGPLPAWSHLPVSTALGPVTQTFDASRAVEVVHRLREANIQEAKVEVDKAFLERDAAKAALQQAESKLERALVLLRKAQAANGRLAEGESRVTPYQSAIRLRKRSRAGYSSDPVQERVVRRLAKRAFPLGVEVLHGDFGEGLVLKWRPCDKTDEAGGIEYLVHFCAVPELACVPERELGRSDQLRTSVKRLLEETPELTVRDLLRGLAGPDRIGLTHAEIKRVLLGEPATFAQDGGMPARWQVQSAPAQTVKATSCRARLIQQGKNEWEQTYFGDWCPNCGRPI